jgi:hypothetical protein
MTALLRYLVSLALHIAWARMGKGPIPAVKLPRRGPVNLPVIGPWQMMIGLWLINRVWERVGHGVKTNLVNHSHPAARAAGSILPDVPGKPSVSANTSGPHPAAPNTTPSAPPANPVPSATVAKSAPAPAPAKAAPSFVTRVLSRSKNNATSPSTNDDTNGNSSHLPAGSVLGGLRRSAGNNGRSNS